MIITPTIHHASSLIGLPLNKITLRKAYSSKIKSIHELIAVIEILNNLQYEIRYWAKIHTHTHTLLCSTNHPVYFWAKIQNYKLTQHHLKFPSQSFFATNNLEHRKIIYCDLFRLFLNINPILTPITPQLTYDLFNQTTSQQTNQSVNQPANQPTNQSTSQPTNQPTNQPANQPTI